VLPGAGYVLAIANAGRDAVARREGRANDEV
jgi:hypothetical protein